MQDYLSIDVNAARNLNRLFHRFMERQRRRDDLSGFSITDIVTRHFRNERLFISPGHPDLLLAMAMATQLFTKMGVARDRIEQMRASVRKSPFPPAMLPIHPKVIGHFRLTFVSATSRYLSTDGCSYSFAEHADRYMRFEWNRELREGPALAQTRPHDAIALLRAGLAKSPNSAEGHAALADVLAQVGQTDEAELAAHKAIALDPDDGRLHYGLARILLSQGRITDAVSQIKLAVACDASEPRFHSFAVQLLLRLDELDAAEDHVRQAISLEPNGPHFLRLRAMILGRKGLVDRAIVVLREAIDRAPEHAGSQIALSHLLTPQGDIPAAISAAEHAIRIKPTEPDYLVHLSRLRLAGSIR